MLNLYWYFEHLTLIFVISDSVDDASLREYLSKYYIVFCVTCAADVRTVSVVDIYIYIYIYIYTHTHTHTHMQTFIMLFIDIWRI